MQLLYYISVGKHILKSEVESGSESVSKELGTGIERERIQTNN